VIVGARTAARGEPVCSELARDGHAELFVADLSSFQTIRAAARAFLATHTVLDVLVNNAGCAMRRREVTPDGHERTWATNFLGPFVLTRELLPALRRAPAPRVVNVSSEAHRMGRIYWDDPDLTRNFRTVRAYAQSKLAQVLFTEELARREPGITVTAVHPGGTPAPPVVAQARAALGHGGSAARGPPLRTRGARRDGGLL
jgi:NAD(P)-dependent dehydrogenase (short-subunit alcohol dehydrogenase family)